MNGTVLIYAVGIGVGAFLMVAIFSLPVSDVAGLVQPPKETKEIV